MKTYFKDIRNLYHVLIGFTSGYDLSVIFGFGNRDKFPLSWDDLRTLLAPVACAVVVGWFAFLWEKRQDKIAKGSSDMRDVYVSMIAAYLGGFIALFYPNMIAAIILSGISIVILAKHYKK